MPMKTLAAILVLIPFCAAGQPEIERWPAVPPPSSADSVFPGEPDFFSPGSDSLERLAASFAISRAAGEVAAGDFWHRLIPRVSVEAGIGIRDIAFTQAGAAYVIPKDSYRLTLGLSLSGLLDGSAHRRAELHLAETEARFELLLRKQLAARAALVRKRSACMAELEALREEIALRESDMACRELLFAQGKADFHALVGARIDLVRLKHAAGRLEAMVRAIGKALAGDPGP